MSMFLDMHAHLEKWRLDHTVHAIIIRSLCEKAFCAGGDIRAVYDNKNNNIVSDYFRLEYNINKMIAHYPKPIIALTQGITMGGGVGISVHASHCVAAETLRWAMPETLIGFFPDVGASYYLSRLPDYIGMYLALTGTSINADTARQLNLVKFIVSQNKFDALENVIAACRNIDFDQITKIIQELCLTPRKTSMSTHIQHTFCFPTLEEIINALKTNNSAWAHETLKQLSQRSPTSLKVTLKQLQVAKNKTVDEVIEMDFYIAKMMLQNHDFFEGIRAAIIDKDKQPQWQPVSISDVAEQDIMQYFLSKAP